MEIILSSAAKKECVKYARYITKGQSPSDSEIEKKAEDFELFIKKNVSSITKHKDTVYPEDCMYGKGYKMFIHDKTRRVIFYEIKRNGDITVHECPHNTDLVKSLKKNKIKPKEDANPETLLKLLELERGDAVAALPKDSDGILPEDVRKDFEEREKKLKKKLDSKSDDKKDSDEDSKSTKEDPRKIWKRRPRKDGHGSTKNYYNVHNPESSISQEQRDELVRNYEESNESLKDIRTLITESNIISLSSYITDRLSS